MQENHTLDHPTIRDRQSLEHSISQGYRPKFLFFWGHQPNLDGSVGKQCFSQWWKSAFTIDRVVYPTAEHYMMAEKARLFNDDVALQKIIAAPHPGAAKKLGRTVLSFDEETWVAHRFDIVVRGNLAKFSQDINLKSFLLNTNKRVLVEASPQDRIWGIGMSERNENAAKPTKWRGLNLLGFALMEVRALLQQEG